MINIVLHEPEMPANTGNIGRTCVATGSSLHLIEPLGFRINDKMLERAGLDYWPKLNLTEYKNYADFMEKHPETVSPADPPRLWYATTKGRLTYSEVSFSQDDFIMFGKETAGIPEEILAAHPDSCIRIPMYNEERSLNLSNAVSIILYEALRQTGFTGLKK